MAQASIPGKIKQDDTKRIIEQGQALEKGEAVVNSFNQLFPFMHLPSNQPALSLSLFNKCRDSLKQETVNKSLGNSISWAFCPSKSS